MYSKTILMALVLAVPAARMSGQARPSSPPAASSQATNKSATVPDAPTLNARIEKFLRITYAWGPDFDIKIGPAEPSVDPELFTVPITVSMGGQADSAEVYVSRDGNFMIRGEISNLTVDPLSETRLKLHVGNSPTKGPASAKVTIYEFGDLECPSCRELESVLRDVLPKHPEVRFVFKHFPLADIHPWAMAAAVASQCAYDQSPEAFWKFHDAFYDTQDATTLDNISNKVKDLAHQAGLNETTFSACQNSPEAKQEVEATVKEGQDLKVNATPTMFVNGRRIVGPDRNLLEQFIEYDSKD